MKSGKRVSHSVDKRSLSSLLLDCPWNQVKVPFDAGISNRPRIFMNSMNSAEPWVLIHLLPLSWGDMVSLKSPMIRIGIDSLLTKLIMSIHTSFLPSTLQGPYMFIKVHSHVLFLIKPFKATQFFCILTSLELKWELFHNEIMPPDSPVDGLAAQLILGSFQKELMSF